MREGWPWLDYVHRLRSTTTVASDRRLPESPTLIVPSQGAKSFRCVRHETLGVERMATIAPRNQLVINNEVVHLVEQELNVEAIRLGIGNIHPHGSDSPGP